MSGFPLAEPASPGLDQQARHLIMNLADPQQDTLAEALGDS
jgi:hypothetical protein